MSKPDEIAARMVADAFEQRKSTPARREYLRLAIAAALTAEREEATREREARREADADRRAANIAREKAEAETLAVLRREAETTARIDARLDKEAASARAAALREAAEVVRKGQQTTTNTRDGTVYTITPRRAGNLDGLAYADAILALIDKEPVSHDTPR